MSTMIEMMARAMAKADDLQDGYGPRAWQDYASSARACLEALREPTPPMLAAMDELAGTINPPDIWAVAIEAAFAEASETKA